MAHLVVTPIVMPLAVGAVMLFLGARRRRWEAGLAIAACAALLLNAIALVVLTDADGLSRAYRMGDWPASFAIVLVADRLSALMLVLAATLGLVSTIFALSRWSRHGPYFYALVQFLLMGLNGAFLTGDLFNLFVFFEVLLAASYGLLLHGSGPLRVKAGLHYIVINLGASLLFLIGVSMIFGVTGTLNMAVLAERIAAAPPHPRSLVQVGAAILGTAFLAKAAAWPLGFWLPRTYDAATPPVAALFAIMTKVGVYILLRLSLLLFGPDAGLSAGFGGEWLFAVGALTIGAGSVGVLAVRDLGRLGGYNLVISAGTLLAAISFGSPAITAGALFYMMISTLGAAALYLIAGLIAVERGDEFKGPGRLEDYDPADDGLYTEEDERAVVITAPVGILSAAFLAITLMVAGIPPLPGFFAKVAILIPLMNELGSWEGTLLITLLVAASLVVLIALVRAGIQIWWVEGDRLPPALRLTEIVPVGALLLLFMVLTVVLQVPLGFAHRAAAQLHTPSNYVDTVLGAEAAP
ncbi:MAG: monovalent cation/H+ antiporter subunit D [Caulobacter sp. 12-67-6]|nr:MAG: monovalent cation/H+ antiporter subunit D [Caulobacter sp. 12-67-6]